MAEMASTLKITYHRSRLEAYLRGDLVFPATLELDLTRDCNRSCPGCPSITNRPAHTLEMGFVERLFSSLEGQTRGLLLTGGEPTMAPTFPAALRLARRHGFVDVVVVTNGTLLAKEHVAAALMEHASAIRVSLYDWDAESFQGLGPTLKRIEALRTRVDREGSRLQIGVSALTCSESSAVLGLLAREAASAGAHWIYFHPLCTGWEAGSPTRADQAGVLVQVEASQKSPWDGFQVFFYRDRYVDSAIEFAGYHAAHFLLVVGADGANYLGAEVKYQPEHVIAEVAGNWRSDFLWQQPRLEHIRSVNCGSYAALGSRHRGVLYNHLIEQFLKRGQQGMHGTLPAAEDGFLLPHIL